MPSLRLAARTFSKSPLTTFVAILSLALGIGANTAIYSLFNQLLLRPLPVERPVELVNFSAAGPKPGQTSCGQAGGCDEVFSYPMFRDLEKAQTVFTGIAAHVAFGANLTVNGQTTNGTGMLVSGSYFPVLGLSPAMGRLFGPGDDRTIGEPHAAVLSYAYWSTTLGADPGILGKSLTVNGQALTIVGVASRGFEGTTIGARPRVYVPMTVRTALVPNTRPLDDRRSYWAYLFARLKPGVTIQQARAAINVPYAAILNDVEAALQTGMSEQTMARFRAKTVGLEPGPAGQSQVPGEAKTPLSLLFGVTAFVLLIACANIANLFLARSAARAGEMAVRLSIGATRRQLVVQLLAESCLLAAIGGAAGLLAARWTLQLVLWLLPAEAAATINPALDPSMLLFAAAIALGAGITSGLFPALHGTRPDVSAALKNQAGQPSGSRSAARFRATLATTQIAMSMALLVGAGLFTRSLVNVSRVNLGLDPDHVITFGVSPVLNGYAPERSRQLFERLEQELTAAPGVTGVTTARVPLIAGNSWGQSVSVEGFEAGPDTDRDSRFNLIGAGYFATMGIPLLAGREFTASDALDAPKVAIVNETFAKKFGLGRDAVGRHMRSDGKQGAPLDVEIVGLVRDARYSEVKAEIPPLFFRPSRQEETLGALHFYVRTGIEPEQFLAAVPKIVASVDPNLPVEDLLTLPQQIRDNVFLDRFISVLSAAFALLATLLAAVGLYGVLAYTVVQRTREIGLRMALGAAPARVRGMVLRQVAVMTAIGGAVGLAAAIVIGRLAASLLFELEGYDPMVLGLSASVLAAVALGAGYVPAMRAARVEPMRALRDE
ncbi:MAG: ABC transporter permease [Acidobacteria bacterium]|nr:ABC transporter permease [Acidobacteriota bacterium]